MKALYSLVGMKHRGTDALVKTMATKEPLTLVRERDNKFDPFAVKVFARDQHVGYVKGSQVRPLALSMDIAKQDSRPAILVATEWPQIEVDE